MSHVIDTTIGVVILAAGKGTRLGAGDVPKVMLEIGGAPIVSYIVDTAQEMGCAPGQIALVVGYKQEQVRQYFGDRVTYAEQSELLGTAHAALTGIQALPDTAETVLIMGGDDSAFYTAETLAGFIKKHVESAAVCSLLSVSLEDPTGLGRVVREGDVVQVLEKEQISEEQKKITEVSTGTYCVNRGWFESMYPTMKPIANLGEFGLPGMIPIAVQDHSFQVVRLEDPDEWFGINTPLQLEEAEEKKRKQKTPRREL